MPSRDEYDKIVEAHARAVAGRRLLDKEHAKRLATATFVAESRSLFLLLARGK